MGGQCANGACTRPAFPAQKHAARWRYPGSLWQTCPADRSCSEYCARSSLIPLSIARSGAALHTFYNSVGSAVLWPDIGRQTPTPGFIDRAHLPHHDEHMLLGKLSSSVPVGPELHAQCE